LAQTAARPLKLIPLKTTTVVHEMCSHVLTPAERILVTGPFTSFLTLFHSQTGLGSAYTESEILKLVWEKMEEKLILKFMGKRYYFNFLRAKYSKLYSLRQGTAVSEDGTVSNNYAQR
jgi:hypothetical protein